jgi:hypothetical protein
VAAVDLVWTDVSVEGSASIFRAEKSASEEPAWECGSNVNRRFGGTYHQLQGRKIRERWRWRRYIPPKRRFIQDLQGNTSEKTLFFIVTAVKTWNPTPNSFFGFYNQPIGNNHIYWLKRARKNVVKFIFLFDGYVFPKSVTPIVFFASFVYVLT